MVWVLGTKSCVWNNSPYHYKAKRAPYPTRCQSKVKFGFENSHIYRLSESCIVAINKREMNIYNLCISDLNNVYIYIYIYIYHVFYTGKIADMLQSVLRIALVKAGADVITKG